ncbi:hypothetical protein [Desulfobacula sp.]|uniref:NHL domain-containing protein n=1 Tax=Desulfobacula sp. TaxID=2593537 RepID=UPI001ED6F260|nr:hypothetical protein [Desulfobacula sp.]
MLKNQKGFLLISIIFIMLLMAVSIFSINYYSVTQIRMASNQIDSVQTGYDFNAIVETSLWELTDNLFWRTVEAGVDTAFNGTTYTRIVRNANLSPFNYPSDYDDAVTIQVTPKGSDQSFQKSFRYYARVFVGADTDLDEPMGMFMDSSGNIYIAGTKGHIIWKIDTFWDITQFAGTGSSGFSGDGGPAASAELSEPNGVFGDSSGNIYIADTNNHRIRKVDTFGNISTFAGTGNSNYSGDGAEAILAELNQPRGIYVDSSDNIYIADTKNHIIRKVDGTTNIITKFAGTAGSSGSSGDGGPAVNSQLNEPRGIYVDSSDDLYIADAKNHIIRKVDGTTSIITKFAGTAGAAGYSGDGGLAVNAQLNEPCGITASSGNLYIADTKNHRIRRVDTTGNIITVVSTGSSGFSGDGGPALLARLNVPKGIFMDSWGNLYIADRGNHKIRRVDTSGNITTVAGTGSSGDSGDGGLATLAQLDEPRRIFVDSSDNLYIADTRNHRIRKVDASGIITTVAGTGSSGFSGDGGLATLAQLDEPHGVFVDSSGNIYIADRKNHRIRKVDGATGIITTVSGRPGSGFSGDGGLATDAKHNQPRGIFKDSSGNLYIADTDNHRIRKVDAATQIITTVAGTGNSWGPLGDGGLATSARIKEPVEIFLDHNYNIFIADRDDRRIRVVNAIDGKIYTLAGTGASGDTTDQPAVLSRFQDPAGITMASGYGGSRIYISDTGNHKIKVLLLKTVYGL